MPLSPLTGLLDPPAHTSDGQPPSRYSKRQHARPPSAWSTTVPQRQSPIARVGLKPSTTPNKYTSWNKFVLNSWEFMVFTSLGGSQID